MGETYRLPIPEFNGSIRVEARPENLSSEGGALPVREALERLGLIGWLAGRLDDPRAQERVVHPFVELLTTSVLLMAQGWQDQDDADTLRDDPVLRMAVSTRRGTSPLEETKKGPTRLPSQPTLSRMVKQLSSEQNRKVLRESLAVLAGRRIRAEQQGSKLLGVMVDIDSLPVEVHGHQPGSKYNGHYRRTIYHPLVASLGEERDLVDVVLREGNVHTANSALDFVLPLLDRVEQEIADVSGVRIDAGFPSEPLMAGLEARGTHYVARIKNNPKLNRMAQQHVQVAQPSVGEQPCTRFHEMEYRAGSWSRERRLVLVVQERPGELFAHHFWLLTSWTAEHVPAADLLELYRARGNAEKLMGEWMSTLRPRLSSSPRPKSTYRGAPPKAQTPSRDSFAANEVLLLLNALAYNAMHVVRTLVERDTGRGWGLQQVREQVLKVTARVLKHARRVTVIVPSTASKLWSGLWAQLSRLSTAPPGSAAASA
jgi:hypothetical protein